MNYHPWRRLRERPDVDITWTTMPEDVLADTDGLTCIRLDSRLLQVERRIAIDHELAHIELGHTCGADTAQEVAACKLSARRLIGVRDLAEAMRWTTDVSEVADILWVTEDVVITRMQHLHPAERHLLLRATAHHRGDES